MALSPENKASPSSATKAMTWLLRSIDQSFRASEARSACSAGIIFEPGSRAAAANRSVLSRTRSGTKRKRPPQRVLNDRGSRENSRTSATGFHRRTGVIRTLFVQTPWERSESFGFQHLAHRRRDSRVGLRSFNVWLIS